MAWNVIRKATSEDWQRLRATAKRFVKRHDIKMFGDTDYLFAVETTAEQDPYLRKLWNANVRRALQHPNADGIAWDYVGYHVD